MVHVPAQRDMHHFYLPGQKLFEIIWAVIYTDVSTNY